MTLDQCITNLTAATAGTGADATVDMATATSSLALLQELQQIYTFVANSRALQWDTTNAKWDSPTETFDEQ